MGLESYIGQTKAVLMKNLTLCMVFLCCGLFPSSLFASNEDVKEELVNDENFFEFIERIALNDTIFGCTYPWALGFDPLATDDDGSCFQPFLGGTITSEFLGDCNCLGDLNDDGAVTTSDLIVILSVFGSFCPEEIPGCTDPIACNYDADASLDDGSCEFVTCAGCLDELACNYIPTATIDNGSCVFPEEGEECDPCDCALDAIGPTFISTPSDQFGECEEGDYGYVLEDACVEPAAIPVVEIRDTIYSDECGNYEHLVTLIAEDPCGNQSTAQFTISVFDNVSPYLFIGQFPNDTTIACTETVPDPEIYVGYDNCDGEIPVFFNETAVDGQCNGAFEVIRTWLLMDCSGNSVEHIQTIEIIDDELPVFISIPEDQFNQCEEQPYTYEAFDNCNDVSVEETLEVIFEDSCGNYEHLVTLTATDSCGNFIDTTFTIIVEDTIEPEWLLEELPEDQFVQCDDIPSAPTLNANDNCNGILTAEFAEDIQNTDCPGQSLIVRTWLAADCSGNSITHTQTLTVEDIEAPDFSGDLPADIFVECDAIPELDVLVANDNCDDEIEVVVEEQFTEGICPQTYTITRTWSVEDCAGNSSIHVQVIEVQDTTAPVFTDVPDDQNNQCDEVPYTSAASDNCSAVVITEARQILSNDDCGNYEHLVTLTAADECGNTADYQFTIVVLDTEAPVFVETLPSNETVECDDVPLAENLTVTDNCSDSNVIFMEELTAGSCPQAYTITRSWTAEDCSGNALSHVQTIEVQDTTAPVFTDVPNDQSNQCEEAPYSAAASDNCGSIVITESREVISEDTCDNYEHLVTLTATDECGNSADYQFTIVVQDTEAPAFVESLPESMDLVCSDGIPAAAMITATDNCDQVSVEFTELIEDTDPCSFFITRTWSVTDCSGNVAEHIQLLSIVDDAPPVFTSLPEPFVLLEADDACFADVSPEALGIPEAEDTCSGMMLTFEDSDTDLECDGNVSFERTWMATDECGNSATFIQFVAIEDTTSPVIVLQPEDLFVECDGTGNLALVQDWLANSGGALAEDNCSDVEWTNDFIGVENGCGLTGTTLVTFAANDACGNSSSTSAILTIQDTSQPEFLLDPQNLTVECNGEGNENELNDWLNTNGGAVAEDACGDISWEVLSDTIQEGCSNGFAVTAIFIAIDACGNSSSASAFFTVIDSTGPVFTLAPDDQANECEEQPYVYVAEDICGAADVEETRQVIFEDECGNYEHEVTLTASDICGNVTEHVFTILVQDTTAPSFAEPLPQDIALTCFGSTSDADELTAIDNCGATTDVVFSQDSIPGNCPGTYTFIRTWSSVDCSNNVVEHVQTITVSDDEQPELTEVVCPIDSTLFLDANCEVDTSAAALGMPIATAIDNCSEPSIIITYEDDIQLLCGSSYNITRIFSIYAMDECGLISDVSSCAQFIQVQDILPPVFTITPEDLTFECEEGTFDIAATDGCSEVNLEESRVVISDDSCGNYVHLVTYTAQDDCGNESSYSFTITVQDQTAPEWNQPMPTNLSISCGELQDPAEFTATDGCDGLVDVNFEEEIVGDEECAAGFVVFRTWMASDCSGNEVIATQEIIVSDSGNPEWVIGIPQDETVECSAVPEPPILEAIDNCDDFVEVVLTEQIIEGPCESRYTLIRTWTATDDCGNMIEGSQTLIVVDTTEPIFIGALPSEDMTVTCSNIPLPPTLTGDNPELFAFDNCDGETVIMFNEYISGTPCEGGGVVFRSWIAIDCIGNLATHTQTIIVVD